MKGKLTKGLVSLCHLLAAWIKKSPATSETKTVYNKRLKIKAKPVF